ncbi:hypothetical protein K1719_041188 [Acacia pycnantha]|nr:hypothetical protein K1719_041188 [Acacia pycnantha]
MDPTYGLADKFRDLVLNLTWEQLRYLIYYHRNIEQLNGQLLELTLERSSIQHRIDEAKNNIEQIEEKVLHWLGEVDELLQQVQKFHEEESHANTKCSITSCPNLWLRYRLSKRAKAIIEEVAEIYAKRNFDRISYRVSLPSAVELTNREGNEGIDSRIPIRNHILEELGEPGVNMIGLCGLGGVGKTTIAKEVAKNQKIFEKVIMATVSQELNIEKIQGQIAEKLSLQLNENNIDVRAFHLCERLRQEKNMLLVLDDLWEELDLGEIGIPLVLFPKLEILELSNLFNRFIAVIWDNQLSHNSFNNLKILIVKRCVFTKLVPLHVLKSLNNLEELEIRSCGMLKTVFDFKDLNDYKEMDSSSLVVPLKRLKLLDLPKLKNIWSNNCQGNVSFPSLKSIDVSYCESLISIFPASITRGMLCDLEELYISECGIDVIVAKDQVSESVAAAFQFPGLTSLKLYCLPQLTNFYPHRHTIEWPHLQLLSIKDCDELEIFEKEVSSSLEIHEEDNTINTKYPLFSHDKVIHNLEELNLVGKLAEMIGSGKYPMFHFPKVKLLVLYAYNATTIFYKTLLKSFPNLEDLQLSGRFVEAFGGDDANALASFFPKFTLNDIPITGNLSPFLVSSSNLTHIEVISCNNLITLMTSSTARSLIHLTLLSISNCNQIEEIITKQEEGEDDGDKEIFFRKLEFVELTDLPRLRRFCCHNYTFRFSLLDKLVITRCPKFKRFSPGLINTPSLNSVQLSQDWGERHEIWDTNLNKTFYQQRFVASREVVLDEDDAIMIRNDQFPTDHCPQVEILVIERFVEEWVTFPYTLLKRFPKLNELHMKNSSFEEIFPSYAPSSSSFHNLTMLRVSKCHQLVYLVTCSTVKSLVNLEILEMDDCEKLEEILRNETNEDVERGVTFNWLRILKLTRLPKLKTQEDKKDFNIEDRATNTRCTNISRSLFSHNKVLLPKLERLELSYLSNNLISLIWDDQLLHNSFNNLKTLILGGCDFMKTVPLRVLKYLNNLEKLEVRYCHELEMVFDFEDLNDYHKEMESSSSVVVPLNLTHLEVKNCFGLSTFMTSSAAPNLVHITHLSISNCYQIEEIITKQEGEDDEDKEIIFNTMKFLELHNLPRLKRFCGYNYTFRFPLLEHVTITECPRLTMFCPGVIHAPRLERIQVHKYEAHIHIWITDLNNTIQHLFTFEEVH